MTQCPECGVKMGAGSVRCRCGWSIKKSPLSEIPQIRADCAVSGCGALTMVREKTSTGWANFCEHHYIEYHHRIAEDRVRNELGLLTVEEMKAHCRKKVKTIFKSVRSGNHVVEREPGQDDEELAA